MAYSHGFWLEASFSQHVNFSIGPLARLTSCHGNLLPLECVREWEREIQRGTKIPFITWSFKSHVVTSSVSIYSHRSTLRLEKTTVVFVNIVSSQARHSRANQMLYKRFSTVQLSSNLHVFFILIRGENQKIYHFLKLETFMTVFPKNSVF